MNSIEHPIEASQNPGRGFYGTMQAHAEQAWPCACLTIGHMTRTDARSVRMFLDSRLGRHFAHAVLDEIDAGLHFEEAISDTAHRWMQRGLRHAIKRSVEATERNSD